WACSGHSCWGGSATDRCRPGWPDDGCPMPAGPRPAPVSNNPPPGPPPKWPMRSFCPPRWISPLQKISSARLCDKMAGGTLILFWIKKGKQLIKNIFSAVIDLGAHGLAVGTDHGIAHGITGIGPDLVIDGFGLLPVPAVHLELYPPDGRTDQGIGTDRGLVPQEYSDPLGLQFSLDDQDIRR